MAGLVTVDTVKKMRYARELAYSAYVMYWMEPDREQETARELYVEFLALNDKYQDALNDLLS